jgi:hypothetical protein
MQPPSTLKRAMSTPLSWFEMPPADLELGSRSCATMRGVPLQRETMEPLNWALFRESEGNAGLHAKR